MTALIQSLLSYPVVVFTALMGVALLYWLSVMFGALDVDVLEVEGAFDGVLEGAAEGALEGAAEAFDGGVDGLADGVGDALEGASDAADAMEMDSGEIAANDGISSPLGALSLRRAPVTVVFSLVVLFGWILSFAASRTLLPLATSVMPLALAGTLLMVMCALLALPLASLASRPLEPVFLVKQGKRRGDFLGQLCTVRTGRVDAHFGQAELDDGGAGLVIQVRSDARFQRGQRGLIIDYDEEREAYVVEPYDDVVSDDEYIRRLA